MFTASVSERLRKFQAHTLVAGVLVPDPPFVAKQKWINICKQDLDFGASVFVLFADKTWPGASKTKRVPEPIDYKEATTGGVLVPVYAEGTLCSQVKTAGGPILVPAIYKESDAFVMTPEISKFFSNAKRDVSVLHVICEPTLADSLASEPELYACKFYSPRYNEDNPKIIACLVKHV